MRIVAWANIFLKNVSGLERKHEGEIFWVFERVVFLTCLKKYVTKLKKVCRFEISVKFGVLIYTSYIPVL